LPELGEAFSLTSQLAATETARLLADPNQPEVLLPSGLYFTPQLGFAVGPIVEGDLPQTRAPSQETSPLVYRLEVESPSLALKSYYLIRNEEDQPRSTWVQMIEDAPTQAATQLSNPTTAVQPVVAPSQQPGWPHVTRDTLPTNVQLEKRKISYPLTVHFDNGVTLAGYDIARGRATPTGEEPPIYLTLFWKRTPPEHVSALDSTRSNDKQELDMGAFDVFVHLANQDGVWETNNGPIAGGYFPSSSSTTILDEVREFTVPPAMSPGKAFFEVGLYRYDPRLATSGQDRLSIVDDEGHAVADAVTLGGLWIGPEPSQADFSDLTPLGVQFDGQIELVGSRVQPKPEDPSQLDVVLGWRSLGRPASDYTAFVHLIDQNGAILSQFDQAPAGADHPSHLWAPNESARSVFPLTMPAGQDPALTRLRMGLYEPVSQKQLPVSALRESSLGAIGDTYVLVPLPE
jgi:hypothetical protein